MARTRYLRRTIPRKTPGMWPPGIWPKHDPPDKIPPGIICCTIVVSRRNLRKRNPKLSRQSFAVWSKIMMSDWSICEKTGSFRTKEEFQKQLTFHVRSFCCPSLVAVVGPKLLISRISKSNTANLQGRVQPMLINFSDLAKLHSLSLQ